MSDVTVASAVAVALTAGVLTFFSPCAYPLLPGYVGFYVSQSDGRSSIGGAVVRGLVAGAGALATLGLFVGATFAVGQSAFETVTHLEPAVGVLLIGFGLLVVFDRGPGLSIPLPKRRSSVLGFAVFGAGYAVAAAGCAAPLFLAVIGLAISAQTTGALLVVGTYVGSVVVLMVALTVATGMGLVAGGGWVMRHRNRLEQLAGVALVLAGIGQLYVAFYVDFYPALAI